MKVLFDFSALRPKMALVNKLTYPWFGGEGGAWFDSSVTS